MTSERPLSRHPGAITHQEAREMARNGEMVEFVVHPALLPALVDWLDGRGLDFLQGPPHEDAEPDALRWFIVSPRDLS